MAKKSKKKEQKEDDELVPADPKPQRPEDEDEEMEEEEDDDEDTGILKGKTTSGTSGDDLEKEKMKLLISHFNEEQMSRYESFRRANVNRSSVKKLANAVLNQSITANVVVTLCSASKVFVGEIMEKAREIQQRMDPPPPDEVDKARPIKPEHLREAWRLFKMENGTVPQAHWRRQGGEGDGMMFR